MKTHHAPVRFLDLFFDDSFAFLLQDLPLDFHREEGFHVFCGMFLEAISCDEVLNKTATFMFFNNFLRVKNHKSTYIIEVYTLTFCILHDVGNLHKINHSAISPFLFKNTSVFEALETS